MGHVTHAEPISDGPESFAPVNGENGHSLPWSLPGKEVCREDSSTERWIHSSWIQPCLKPPLWNPPPPSGSLLVKVTLCCFCC